MHKQIKSLNPQSLSCMFMCSLAIRLWQQNDTVAQNKAAVDLTDTKPIIIITWQSSVYSALVLWNNLMKLLINTCKSCTKLHCDWKYLQMKHKLEANIIMQLFKSKVFFFFVQKRNLSVWPQFEDSIFLFCLDIYIQTMKKKVSETKIKCILILTHIA